MMASLRLFQSLLQWKPKEATGSSEGCVWSKCFLILPPRLMESQGCYRIFPCKRGRWKVKRETVLVLPLEKKKKKIRKIHSLLLSLSNSVTSWPALCGSHFPSGIAYVLTATASNHTHVIWLKMLHIRQKVCLFLKIPTVNRPGAWSPIVITQMHLTTGRKQTGTANFMGQLWREVCKYVEESKKKICLARSHGAVMFHEIHILC